MILTPVRFGVLVFAMLVVAGQTASQAARFEVRLLRPDSLAGWDHGDPAPSGWTIEGGVLSGSGRATPLLSAWTFGDFQLRLNWSAPDGAQLKVLLPEVPSGKGLELVLCEGEGCGRLTDGENQLAPGGTLEGRSGKMHSAFVRRQAGKLSLKVDGRWLYEVPLGGDRRFGLGLAASGDRVSVTGLRLLEPEGQPMFNGRDLAGWWTGGDLSKWQVRPNGEVVRSAPAGDYLRTERSYANFTWTFEYKMQERGNSGLGLRTPREGWPTADGMELQLLDTPYDAKIKDEPCMAVYGHVPPLGRADKSERWNRVVVKADGWMISAWMNGELVQQVNTFHHPELKHRFLSGWLGFQDHGAWIRVRNAHILEAPEGLGLSAWYKPRPALATAAILDRLINPERLSVADGIRSGVAHKTIAGEAPAEHVLAELAGPGAIVGITRTGDEGKLAFYFDGEAKPRIECTPAELQASLPPVGHDTNPLLTCLPYKRSLKIVLRDAARAEYRFDYLKLPRSLAVESFVDPQSGFPRGWLPAVTTLLRWLGSGRHHEHDPLPRFSGEAKTVEPGQSVELVRVEGAGIVHAFKLLAPKTVLENNDLWLDVTIDGQQQPAVSAPVRYLFPALDRNYENYVLEDQGGPTLLLAMPFGDGITVSASNRGGAAIPGVSVSLAVEQATDANRGEIAGRMRLRGVFLPAQEGAGELVRQQGTGRWVGLVYQTPEGEQEPQSGPAGIQTLLVDGRPVGGWSAPTLDSFLGGTGDFRKHLSGRQGTLQWRYFLLAPVEFRRSLVLKTGSNQVGERLAWFYLKK